MRNLVAALVFVIAAAAFASSGTPANPGTPADENAHRTDAVEEAAVATTCERYGQAADGIIEKRFPKPEPGPRSHILADDGGYTGQGYAGAVPLRLLSWWCEKQHLMVEVRGAWVLDARDIHTALEHLLADFRDQGLEPAEDGIEITLEPLYVGESAHFDQRD